MFGKLPVGSMLRRLPIIAMLTMVSCAENVRPVPVEELPSSAAIVECQNAIDHRNNVDSIDYTKIHDVVLLATSKSASTALQVARLESSGLFGKTGLLVRRNSRVELRVPEEFADEVLVGWGGTNDTDHIVVGPCSSEAEWLVFAGGYVVERVGCFDITVRSRSEQTTVSMGIGAPCPGQEPPPQPSAS